MQMPRFHCLRLPGALLIAASAFLAGCASKSILPEHVPELALPRSVHVIQHGAETPTQDAMLVAQKEAAGVLRWSLFDPLGLPLARQLLQDGQWRNDGFLPPNPTARALFSALIFAWTPQAALANAYPAGSWSQILLPDGSYQRQLQQNCRTHWTIIWPSGTSPDTFNVYGVDGLRWQISPLKETP